MRYDSNDLDLIFDNIKKSAIDLSTVLKTQIAKVENDDYDLPVLIKSLEILTKILSSITELAPFVALKQQIEGLQQFKEWLLGGQNKIVGKEREKILEIIIIYQESLIIEIDQNAQYTLI